jgi:hypothetical protein
MGPKKERLAPLFPNQCLIALDFILENLFQFLSNYHLSTGWGITLNVSTEGNPMSFWQGEMVVSIQAFGPFTGFGPTLFAQSVNVFDQGRKHWNLKTFQSVQVDADLKGIVVCVGIDVDVNVFQACARKNKGNGTEDFLNPCFVRPEGRNTLSSVRDIVGLVFESGSESGSGSKLCHGEFPLRLYRSGCCDGLIMA